MVYKYYAPTDHNLEALLYEYFWFSKRKYLNDPYDVCADLALMFPKFKEELKKVGIDTTDSYSELLDRFAICCFSKKYDNKTMWAHYAQNYQGWCLAFDNTNDLIDGHFDTRLFNVDYLSKFPDLDNGNHKIPNIHKLAIEKDKEGYDLNEISIKESLNDEKKMDFLFRYLLLIKNKEWNNEKEIRIILTKTYLPQIKNGEDCSVGYKIIWKPNILKKIIIGTNISKKYFLFLRFIAELRKIPLTKIIVSQETKGISRFKLEEETIYVPNKEKK